jgi:hypothetical protein
MYTRLGEFRQAPNRVPEETRINVYTYNICVYAKT